MLFVKKWKTNVITHIPEDIKLELTDGVLTLKAGSKVYVPNGFEDDGTTPKFDEVVVTSDLILTKKWGTAEQMAIFLLSDNSLFQCGTARLSSGTTAPTATTVQVWYDTTNNIIRRYSGGSEQGTMQSLPIAICTKTSGNTDAVLASIDQVCNGFSYVGLTVFALPNVKGLMPNGINADGSLSNIEFTTKSLMQTQFPYNSSNRPVYINEDSLYLSTTTDYDKNKNYNRDFTSYVTTCFVGIVSATNNVVTSVAIGEGYSKNNLYQLAKVKRSYYEDDVEVPSSSITDRFLSYEIIKGVK